MEARSKSLVAPLLALSIELEFATITLKLFWWRWLPSYCWTYKHRLVGKAQHNLSGLMVSFMGKMLPNGFTEGQKLKANTNTITWKSRMTIILCILIGLVMCKLTELVVLWTKPRWRQRTITNTKAITWGCRSQTLLSKLALIPH